MNEYLKRMIKSPRNPNAENETCEESAGVFRFDDWVMIYGSYGERDTQFEIVCNRAAKALVWDRDYQSRIDFTARTLGQS